MRLDVSSFDLRPTELIRGLMFDRWRAKGLFTFIYLQLRAVTQQAKNDAQTMQQLINEKCWLRYGVTQQI